jgi:hypothetical protein
LGVGTGDGCAAADGVTAGDEIAVVDGFDGIAADDGLNNPSDGVTANEVDDALVESHLMKCHAYRLIHI